MTEENKTISEREKEAKWYVVHTYSGHENKVKVNIEKMVENRGHVDDIFQVVVPTEEYVSTVGGVSKKKERKLFPGYVFVKMIINDVSWYLVRNTRGVTGFVGPGSKPVPLTENEMRAFGVGYVPIVDIDVEVGDSIRIISDAFKDVIGTVEEVNMEKKKVKALVSIFGRDTSVEVDFSDIEKI
ncbi:MAG: transcription termination/antitermination protein NusG [Lagierella massiliensis]|nr:transcription termination/antitermination protein NusG [Lagierella massiliensis]